MSAGNEPAYPVPFVIDGNWVKEPPAQYCGETKREAIAKALMAGFIASSRSWPGDSDMKEAARRAVVGADRLLAELERGAK